MSVPVSLASLTRPDRRIARCVDCPATIEQVGTQIGVAWAWGPIRCPACIMVRDARLAEERSRERVDDARGAQLQAERQVARALEELQVPPRYRAASLETFELHGSALDRACQQNVVRHGIRYVGTWPEPAQDTLVLRGGYGTGKGHWSWSVAKAIVGVTGARIRVVKLADMVRRLRASWGAGEAAAESETGALKFYRELDLLVIDEVSTHAFYGQNIHQHLYDVLDHRLEWSRPTILTSNESDTGLEGILRPALMDRLQHRGGILEFGTASFRALAR